MTTTTQVTPEVFDLTPGEKQICAHDQVGQLAPYGIQTLFLSFVPRWTSDQICRAAQQIIETHPVFSARLHRVAGGDFRRSQTASDQVKLSQLPSENFEATLVSPTFELNGGPGIRMAVTTDGDHHRLGIVLHPAFGDSGVLTEIEQGFVGLLSGKPHPPTPLEHTVSLPSEKQRDRLEHWRAKLDEESCFNARLPRRHGGVEGLDRGTTTQTLTAETVKHLRQCDTPLDVILVTALGLVLSRYCGHTALRFGLGQTAIAANRRSEDILPLCLDLPSKQGFAAAISTTKQALSEARANILPSEVLVQDMLRRDGADRHPMGALVLHLHTEQPLPVGITRDIAPFPAAQGECLLLVRQQADGGLSITANYARDLFEPALISRVLVHIDRMLQAGLADPDRPMCYIPLLNHEELKQFSAPYEDSEENDPRPVHQIIAEQAVLRPEKTALICGGEIWSHDQLNRRANRLAHRLLELGVGAEAPVAILVDRGNEAVMAILAAMKAGGAYIPVEPDHPETRNHHILKDAGVQVVITRKRYLDRLPTGLSAQCLCLDDAPGEGQPDHDPEVSIHPEQLAYIMYTSGSTGKPKGVAVEHGPLTHHNQATARVYEMSSESRELPFLPFSSDGGHERWMVPLMMGGSVVIPDGPLWTPEQTFDAMRTYGCNNASIPTTYLQQLAEWAADTGEAPDMRLYSFGGEGLAQTTFDLLSRELRSPLLINGYGPTETIMTPMVWKVRAGTQFEGAYAPLGRAVGNRRAYVLDDRMMPCPIGVVGEIHLGGEGMARGYVNRPGTTASAFIPDPFGPELDGINSGRLYRSGDLGRWREDGTIEFLGRVDLQIKLNGYRIEPGEIEAALLEEPDVSEALVLLRNDDGNRRLVGYVVAPPQVSEDTLMHALEARLPKYMLPSNIVVLDRMPTNPNAKLDRAALPVPGTRKRPVQGVEPSGEVETGILQIWRDATGTTDMGVTDDFFDMGGKSLTALKVLAQMRKLWPTAALTIADMFDAPTVRGLARRIVAGDATGRQAIALRGSGSKPMLYCFPGLLVSTREYMRLTNYLGADQPVTGFLCHSLNEDKRLNVSVQDVVAGYVDHIRRESAGRPCAFLGWSWGGLLAWETARQLQGEIDLRLTGMVDVCDLGRDFAPDGMPEFAPGEWDQLHAEMVRWLQKTKMRDQWDALISVMDPLCYDQFLRFIANEAEPLPFDGPEVSSREHTFWVLIDNALVFRQYRLSRLDVPVASFSAGDSLSRGLNLVDWRQYSSRANPAAVVPGTNHLHIIGDQLFHARFKSDLDKAFANKD